MTKKKLTDPNDPNFKEGQRIAGLMELEMRTHKPSIEARLYAVIATAAVNCVSSLRTTRRRSNCLRPFMDNARSAIPSIMAAKNTGQFDLQ
jgi:hypothetical protein